MLYGLRLDGYKTGDVVFFRRPATRFDVNYSKFLRPEFAAEPTIPFVVGVSTLEWLEAEMKRRIYRPMIGTRFHPARLPD